MLIERVGAESCGVTEYATRIKKLNKLIRNAITNILARAKTGKGVSRSGDEREVLIFQIHEMTLLLLRY